MPGIHLSNLDLRPTPWNPGLVEIAVLGCHPESGDEPEALALAVHQLRQAPDYLDTLATPLPMLLASLAQAYVLPPRAGEKTKKPRTTLTRRERSQAAQLKQTWPLRSASSPGPPWRTKPISTPNYLRHRAWPRTSPPAHRIDKLAASRSPSSPL